MNLLLSPKEYEKLQESCKQFEKDLDNILTEGFGDVIGSPIKYIKLKNNSKKYQKILVKKALNDVDYAKRKEKGADNLDAKQKEVLTQANKAKNQALSDKASAISGRMSDLATNDGLKQVEKLAKSRAKIAAAETTLKAASGEELKKLKIKIADWKSDAADASGALDDYSKKDGDEKKPEGDKVERLEGRKEKINTTLEKQQQSLSDLKDKKAEATGDKRDEIEKQIEQIEDNIKDNKESLKDIDKEIAAAKGTKPPATTPNKTPSTTTKVPGEGEGDDNKEAIEAAEAKVKTAKAAYDKVKDGDDEGAKIDANIKWQQEQQQLAKAKGDDEAFQGHGDEIGELMQKKQKLGKKVEGTKEQTPEQKAKNSKEGKIERYKKLLADTDDEEKKKEFQSKIDKLQKESWESFLDPNFERLVEAELVEFENPLSDIKHKLNERAQSFVNESVKDKFARLLNEKRSV